MANPRLDRIDLKILAQRQRNGRMTNVVLSEAVGLSASPCLLRVRRLEKAGYITGYGAQLNLAKLGETVSVFTEVTLKKHKLDDFARFEAEIGRVEELAECHLVSGGYDYLLKFVARGVGHYQEVVEAAAEQMMRLPYATGYFGYAAEPSIRLAARLAEAATGDLDHVSFTLGGSDAIDSALRFVRFFMHAKGTPERRHVVALQRGYHGSSSTGAGVTGLPAFHRDSELPLPRQHHISNPYPYRNPVGTDPEAIIAASLAELHALVEEIGPEKVAAFCEPITGSGGIIVPPEGWLRAMREACRGLGILFVADEVITGFGRTGPLFACEDEGIVPDMTTVAKGLTSGYAPMGAVLVSDAVYATIRDGSPAGATIGHGLTYSAHPVSAAVGPAVLDLYEGGLLAQGRRVGAYFTERLAAFADHPLVGEVRGRGMLQGLELVTDKARKTRPDPALGLPDKLAAAGIENRLIFRAFPDGAIGFAPPLCCTEADVDLIVERLGSTLDAVLADPALR